uniref:Uncharacterized protein n=1 Tax=Spongospora subterranea TaxID=70186 RepID=A0A0H5R6J4_9EUKA|eukprot:CRZ09392.1 hypothetical protein [Spongospora subterranea]
MPVDQEPFVSSNAHDHDRTASFDVQHADDVSEHFHIGQLILQCQDGFWIPSVVEEVRDLNCGRFRYPLMRHVLVAGVKSCHKPRWIPCISSSLRIAHRSNERPRTLISAIPPQTVLDLVSRSLQDASTYRFRELHRRAAEADCTALQILLFHLDSMKQCPGTTDHPLPDDWVDVLQVALRYWFTSVNPNLRYHQSRAADLHASCRVPCIENQTEIQALTRKAAEFESSADVAFWDSKIDIISKIVDNHVASAKKITSVDMNMIQRPSDTPFRQVILDWGSSICQRN